MATISVSVDESAYERLAMLARERDTDPEALVRRYVDFLAAGGDPLPFEDDPSAADIAALLSRSSAWSWLDDEPELYTLQDGEPV